MTFWLRIRIKIKMLLLEISLRRIRKIYLQNELRLRQVKELLKYAENVD